MVMTQDKVLDSKYYDDSDSVGINDIPITLTNPTRAERREIKFLKTIYKGVMFVTGGPGQGKDLFGVVLSYLMKRYFNRRVLLDFKPKRLFGEYTYFNPQLMMSEISKMARLSGVEGVDVDKPLSDAQAKVFTEAAKEWIDDNVLLFQNAVVYFSELKRYCYKRNPSNRINKFVGALNDQWRHLDMLVIGTHLQENEIDQFTFMDKAKLKTVCKWMLTRPNTTRAKVYRDVYLNEDGVFNASLKPVPYLVDGGAPRDFLTHKDTVFTITPQGIKEAKSNIILSLLKKAGATSVEVIADSLSARLDETLSALYSLSEMGYVAGNRFFDLYNSKGRVNLVPTLRKEA